MNDATTREKEKLDPSKELEEHSGKRFDLVDDNHYLDDLTEEWENNHKK